MEFKVKKPVSVQLAIVGTVMAMSSFYALYQRSAALKVFQTQDPSKMKIKAGLKYYNPVTKPFSYDECFKDLQQYFLNLFGKLFGWGVFMIVVAVCVFKLHWKTKLITCTTGIVTTLIYIGLIVFDLLAFVFNQEKHMTIHDAWMCSEQSIHVTHAAYINVIIYAQLFMHIACPFINIGMYLMGALCNRRVNDDNRHLRESKNEETPSYTAVSKEDF